MAVMRALLQPDVGKPASTHSDGRTQVTRGSHCIIKAEAVRRGNHLITMKATTTAKGL